MSESSIFYDKACYQHWPKRSSINVSQEFSETKSNGILELFVLMERIENDKDTAKELLALFLTESAEIVNRLMPDNNLENSGDLLTREAHRLKGMCRDIGCENLAELA